MTLKSTFFGNRFRMATLTFALILALGATLMTVSAFGTTGKVRSDRTAPHRAGAQPASVPGTQVNQLVTHWHAINQTNEPCTTSTAYARIPGTSVQYTGSGKVIAMFQGEWFNQDRALIRLVIDGVVQSGPGDDSSPVAANSGNDAGSSIDMTNGFNFISDSLSSGTHTVEIDWASVGGGQICVDEGSLIVLAKS
jgi:hypothetical protein